MQAISKTTNKDGSIEISFIWDGKEWTAVGQDKNPQMGLNMLLWREKRTQKIIYRENLLAFLRIFAQGRDFDAKESDS